MFKHKIYRQPFRFSLPLIFIGRLPYLGLHCRKVHKRQVSDDCSDFRRRLSGTSLCRRIKDVLYILCLYRVFEFFLCFSLQQSKNFAPFVRDVQPSAQFYSIHRVVQFAVCLAGDTSFVPKNAIRSYHVPSSVCVDV